MNFFLLFAILLVIALIIATVSSMVGAGVVDPKQATMKNALRFLLFSILATVALFVVLFIALGVSMPYWQKSHFVVSHFQEVPRTVYIISTVLGILHFLVQVAVAIRIYVFSFLAACVFVIASTIMNLTLWDGINVAAHKAAPMLGLPLQVDLPPQQRLALMNAWLRRDPIFPQIIIASSKTLSIEERHRAVTEIHRALAQRRANLNPADKTAVEEYRQDDLLYQKLLTDLRNDAQLRKDAR